MTASGNSNRSRFAVSTAVGACASTSSGRVVTASRAADGVDVLAQPVGVHGELGPAGVRHPMG